MSSSENPAASVHRPFRRLSGSQARQTVATILVAVALAASTWIAESATGGWQSAVRATVAQSTAVSEVVRYVYADEALFALQVAVAQTRGQSLQLSAEAAGEPASQVVRLEAEEDLEWAWQLRRSHEDLDHLVDDAYWNEEEGYDVAARIVDLQEHHGAELSRDPDTLLRSADRTARLAQWVAGITIPVVLVYLLLELVQYHRRTQTDRRTTRAPVDHEDDGSVAPSLGDPHSWRRAPRVVALTAWALLGILPLAQMQAQQAADRAEAQSARAAVQTSHAIAAGSQFTSFLINAQRDVVTEELRIAARAYAATLASPDLADAQTVAVGAHLAAMEPVTAVVTSMTSLPSTADGLDPTLAEAVAARPEVWTHLQAEQVRLLDEAQKAQRVARTLSVTLLLASLTLTLATIAQGPSAAQARMVRVAPGVLMLLTFVLAVLGLTT